jgi:histidinol-phosphate aminotransferase
MSTAPPFPRPVPALAGTPPYRLLRPAGMLDLYLDANEGSQPGPDLLAAGFDPDLLRHYPDAGPLTRRIAERLGVGPEQVLVTDGSNDALDRACRAVLCPGREMVAPVPTFEMLLRYARLTGAEVREVPWLQGPWPLEEVMTAAGPKTAAVAFVTPNNPTGAAATADDLRRLSEALPGVLIIADLAYTEFAERDLTPEVLAIPNALLVRTLSKAWGLAGVRVGYAAGPAEVIGWLRTAGQNYPVGGMALEIAARRLGEEAAVADFIARVRREREQLTERLRELGAEPLPSQANFVLVRLPDAAGIQTALAGEGIAVRAWPGDERLGAYLRLTCPGDDGMFARLERALTEVLGRGAARPTETRPGTTGTTKE